MSEKTCYSCEHYRIEPSMIYGPDPQYCALDPEKELTRCENFEYEPGSDEAERVASDGQA